MNDIENLKYPIGQYVQPQTISDVDVDRSIKTLQTFPLKLKNLVAAWNDDQLDTQYREGGWKVRQLINHIADSHMMSYLRFKLALTEQNPTIKTYDQERFAELQDSFSIRVQPALTILRGLHERWVFELNSLTNRELEMAFFHPELKRNITLRESLLFYAWHCDHHSAQIQNLKKERGW